MLTIKYAIHLKFHDGWRGSPKIGSWSPKIQIFIKFYDLLPRVYCKKILWLVGWPRYKTLEIDLIQTHDIEVNRAFRDTVFNGKKIVFLQWIELAEYKLYKVVLYFKLWKIVWTCYIFNQIVVTLNELSDITVLVTLFFLVPYTFYSTHINFVNLLTNRTR